MLFKTTNTEVWRVIWPGALLLAVMVGLLIGFTISGSHYWERHVTDEISGESIGRCTNDGSIVFLFPLYALHFLPMILAGIMAFKTSGVDDLFSESKWVLAFILVQLQVRFCYCRPLHQYDSLLTHPAYFRFCSWGLPLLPCSKMSVRISNSFAMLY